MKDSVSRTGRVATHESGDFSAMATHYLGAPSSQRIISAAVTLLTPTPPKFSTFVAKVIQIYQGPYSMNVTHLPSISVREF